jgi:ligand-binding sensor domain-containing protein
MRSAISHIFKLSTLLLLALLALTSCTSNSGILGGGDWQESGLANQHIQTLAVDTNNSQNVYAGGTGGEVFASTDGGQHWAEHDRGLPFPNSINQLAFDTSGKKLYAATADGLFLSTDGAQHWGPIPHAAEPLALRNQNIVALTFDLNHAQTIYAATANNVFISTNSGASWSNVGNWPGAGATINGLTYDSNDHQLWAATALGVYRYDGAGSTWQRLNNGLPANIQVYTVQPADSSGGTPNLIFAGTSQGFFRSPDDGAHWMQSQQSLQRVQVHSIFVDFQQPTTVYAGTTGVGVLQSSDSGQSWGGLGPDFPYSQSVNAIQLGGDGYGQVFAASNAVYFFPGSSGGLSPSRLLPLIFVIALFVILYLFVRSRQRRRVEAANQPRTPRHNAPPEPPSRAGVPPTQKKDTGSLS